MSSRCPHLAPRRKWRMPSAPGSGYLFFFLKKFMPFTFASSRKEICHLLFFFLSVKWKRVPRALQLFTEFLPGAVFPLPAEDKAVARPQPLGPLQSSGTPPLPPAPFSAHTTCVSHSALSQVCRPPVLHKQSFCHLIFEERFFKIQIPSASLHLGSV